MNRLKISSSSIAVYVVVLCMLIGIAVTGSRTVTVVSENGYCQSQEIRSIIGSDNKVDTSKEQVRLSLKSHKVFLFNKETENRIYFGVN